MKSVLSKYMFYLTSGQVDFLNLVKDFCYQALDMSKESLKLLLQSSKDFFGSEMMPIYARKNTYNCAA